MEPSDHLLASQVLVEHEDRLMTFCLLSSKLRCSSDPTMLLKWDDLPLKKGLKMENWNKVRKQCQDSSVVCFITDVYK